MNNKGTLSDVVSISSDGNIEIVTHTKLDLIFDRANKLVCNLNGYKNWWRQIFIINIFVMFIVYNGIFSSIYAKKKILNYNFLQFLLI